MHLVAVRSCLRKCGTVRVSCTQFLPDASDGFLLSTWQIFLLSADWRGCTQEHSLFPGLLLIAFLHPTRATAPPVCPSACRTLELFHLSKDSAGWRGNA